MVDAYPNVPYSVLQAEQTRLLYAGIPLSLFTNALIAAILIVVQRDVLGLGAIIVWFTLLATTLLLRAALAVAYHRALPANAAGEAWLTRFRISATTTGVAWGLAGILLFPAHDIPHQVFMAFAIAGVTAGAVATLSVDRIAALAFIFVVLVPLITRLFAEGEEIPVAMGAMGTLYLGFLSLSVRRAYIGVRENICLRFEAVAREQALQESAAELQVAKERAEEASRMLHTVLDTIPVRIFWKDRNLNFLGCNQFFAQDAGRQSEQEMIGLSDYDMGWRDVADLYRADDARVIATGQAKLNYEEPQVSPTGANLWLRTSKVPLRDAAGAVIGVLGTYEDITERKVMELSLAAAKDTAERANRAKSQFLSSMSHELRTPLNAVLGFGQLLEMDATLNEQQHDQASEIVRAGQHLLEMVSELLDLPGIESGNLQLAIEPVACGEMAAVCLALIQPMAQTRGIRLVRDPMDELMVRADRTRMKQVLINLLSNAVKYNRDGGQVRLHAAPAADDAVRIMVTDSGFGIPAQRRHELFQPFNRLGAEGGRVEGTGIGLTISKRLTELMGGRIGVESEAGTGSTFWIELPRAILQAAPGHAMFEKSPPP